MSAACVCATCGAANVPLLQYARCKSVSQASYARHAQGGCQSFIETKYKQPFTAGDQDKNPFTAIDRNAFLHDRTEKTYQLLIETLRMRQEDEYALESELMSGTIYDQVSTGVGVCNA
ncbi:hypothetical protein Q7P37_007636 [Cladosporium fusiforme]